MSEQVFELHGFRIKVDMGPGDEIARVLSVDKDEVLAEFTGDMARGSAIAEAKKMKNAPPESPKPKRRKKKSVEGISDG